MTVFLAQTSQKATADQRKLLHSTIVIFLDESSHSPEGKTYSQKRNEKYNKSFILAYDAITVPRT